MFNTLSAIFLQVCVLIALLTGGWAMYKHDYLQAAAFFSFVAAVSAESPIERLNRKDKES